MKKQIAVVLTAALLALPASTGFVLADMIPQEDTINVTSAETVTSTESEIDSNIEDAINPDVSSETEGTQATKEDIEENSENDIKVVTEEGEKVEAGTLPGSSLFWFDDLVEKVQEALAFNPATKADRMKTHASERLAEACALSENGDEEKVEVALTRYNDKVVKAQEFLEKIEDPESEEAKKVQEALTKVNAKNVIVLGSLLEKLPPEAAQKIAINIVRGMEKAVIKADSNNVNDKTANDTTQETTENTEGKEVIKETETSAVTDENENETNENTDEDTKEALRQFGFALGVMKLPQGNAYGYYKNLDRKIEKKLDKLEKVFDCKVNYNSANDEKNTNDDQITMDSQKQVDKKEEIKTLDGNRSYSDKKDHNKKDYKYEDTKVTKYNMHKQSGDRDQSNKHYENGNNQGNHKNNNGKGQEKNRK